MTAMKRPSTSIELTALSRRARAYAAGEDGIVMVAALLILLSLAAMGTAAMMTSTVEMKLSGNDLLTKQVFHSADAATQEGMEWLSTKPVPPGTVGASTKKVKNKGDGDAGNDMGGEDFDGAVSSAHYRYDVQYKRSRMMPGSSTNYRDFYYDMDSEAEGINNARSEIDAVISKIYRVDY